MASDPRELPVGRVVYSSTLRKYFVMEDECGPCIEEWGASMRPHVALWIPGGTDRSVTRCEDALTPDRPVPIEINPPAGRPVDTRPLFAAGKCWPAT